MDSFLEIMNALADRTRLRLLLSLRGREICACQLVEFAGLADSTVSRHMSILKSAGLVESRKSGRWVHYRLAERSKHPHTSDLLAVVMQCLSNDPQAMEDTALIAEIIKRGGAHACSEAGAACANGAQRSDARELEHQD